MSAVNSLSAVSVTSSVQKTAGRQIDLQSGQPEAKPQDDLTSRQDTTANRRVAKSVSSDISIDPETRSVIFQTIDINTDAVVSQYPSDVQLSLRAYFAAATAEASASSSGYRTA